MAAYQINLNSYFGDTVAFTIVCTRVDGTIVDLTGAVLTATFKNAITDADPGILQKTSPTGITVASPTTGIAKCKLSPTDLTYGGSIVQIYQVDVKVKEANGDEWTVAIGTLTMTLPVTRAT